MSVLNYGFRICGGTNEPRRLVDSAAAFAGYAACDPRAETQCEAYLSAFCYGEDFCARADDWGRVDTKGFEGPCWAPYIWWDIDRDGDLEGALHDTRRLAEFVKRYFDVGDDKQLIFLSGNKGFHVGIPTAIWLPEPSVVFNQVARQFAESAAEAAGVTIDNGVYSKVQAFRAPNSRHAKTGLYKRRLTLDELNSYSVADVLRAAQSPIPFSVPAAAERSEQATSDWLAAVEQVKLQTEAHAKRRAEVNGNPRLNQLTLEFIAHGASIGDRHRLLFSAAANLAEFGCPPLLAHALLTQAARDSGLPPANIRRQIDRGLAFVNDGESSDA